MVKKFKVKTKFDLGDRIIRRIGRIIKRRPKIIDLNDEKMPPKCIMIGNHNGAGGPFHYRAFLEGAFMSWGAHQMCENFRSRRRYLYHTFYRQKLGWGKFKAFVMSILFGFIAPLAYGFAGIIPVYYDSRIMLTYKYSMNCLEKDVSVFVLPEDSSEGYKEVIEGFWPGFLQLSKLYYKRHNADLPIYTLHYSKKPKKIVIGKPMYYRELSEGRTDREVMRVFIDYMNSLKDANEN